MYRRLSGPASCRSGDFVADIGMIAAVCHIGASNPIPVLVPPLQGSRSFGNCTLSISGYGMARMCTEARNPGRLAFSPRPRPLLSAWAQPRTGMPDDAGGRGRSSGPGCADRAAPSPAARRSAPSPGDWSMVSAPTRSSLCGLPRLIGSLLSQESVHNRIAARLPIGPRSDATPYRLSFFRPLLHGESGTWRPERCGWGWENRRSGLAGTSRG